MHTASELPAPAGLDAPRRLAVLGSPIAHSRSPLLHTAAYRTLGLNWSYEAVPVDSDRLASFIQSRDEAWRGLSLTMPLKHTVLPLLDSLDEIARLTSAANTVLFDADSTGHTRRCGFNTDVAGIVRALRAAGVTEAAHVHLFGGGATAGSAIAAAAELGAEQVSIGVRAPERAEQLRGLARSVGVRLSIAAFGAEPEHVPDLIISTLPGSIGARAAETIVDGAAIEAANEAAAPFFDVAYDPWPTPAATAWQQMTHRRGGDTGVVLSGLPMLVHQALLQVRIFVGGDPEQPIDRDAEVLAAMLHAVGLDAVGRPRTPGLGEDGRSPMPES